ncbi:hypothetical protein D9619_007697 [Psilocybe cf. subviscida]|uniref:Uncharacterized protein n=1 Tax=Psilocybe cf. subviscida TaxID=2480587 RepID=A0A8H5ATZ0_9AGAR|nr:hypothetical protein D9619_007697 [Psilocybe cf. subviscida]
MSDSEFLASRFEVTNSSRNDCPSYPLTPPRMRFRAFCTASGVYPTDYDLKISRLGPVAGGGLMAIISLQASRFKPRAACATLSSFKSHTSSPTGRPRTFSAALNDAAWPFSGLTSFFRTYIAQIKLTSKTYDIPLPPGSTTH